MTEVQFGRPQVGVWAASAVSLMPVRGIPSVVAGDDLAALVVRGLALSGIALQAYDVVVVTHKVVSKAEGQVVSLSSVVPSSRAVELGVQTDNDPRLVEVILSQTSRVLSTLPGVLVCETVHGLVCANAGVDRSNVDGGDVVTLLPRDADASASALRDAWSGLCADGGPLGVVICDTFGRPFREAGVNVAIGVAGMPAITDYRGLPDTSGYLMRASALATADEIASAAELVMGKVDDVPVAVVRGLRWAGSGAGAGELQRDPARDVFRP
ncbi:MAG TPA: coenzyme F420-0:L-glutamate ligase [Candidatus Dormibacteraeota bacterium]|nr:coenzyme F420-0:L-glutamate ligase [Candidatus Dormibacteraeota bacterium]